jgi:large-conductance mechanosensitive channel
MKNNILAVLIATIAQSLLFTAYLYSRGNPNLQEILSYSIIFLIINLIVYLVIVPFINKMGKSK